MAIAVDDTTVARWSGTPNNGVDVTSASFTPPNTSLLVVCINIDTSWQADASIVVAVSGGSLSWVAAVEDQRTALNEGGYSGLWYALVTTGASMTVSVQRSSGEYNGAPISAKCYIITGHDTATPIGATGSGRSTTNNLTAAAYTSATDNSRGFGCATDWAANGAPASTDTEDAADYAGAISVESVYKAADTTPSGTAVTLNFNAAGAGGAIWTWVAAEIKPVSATTVRPRSLLTMGVGS